MPAPAAACSSPDLLTAAHALEICCASADGDRMQAKALQTQDIHTVGGGSVRVSILMIMKTRQNTSALAVKAETSSQH